MSLQGALSTALSSLAAEQRNAALIANNIANANTDGYVRRELPRGEKLVAGGGAGVETGVAQRAADAALAAASRAADAAEAYADRMQGTLEVYNKTVGQPADETSLPSRLGAFQDALDFLSGSPDDAVAQSQVLATAQNLLDTLHGLDVALADGRAAADLAVARDVETVNTALANLAENDRQMAQAAARGASTAEYEDRRDVLLAGIGKVVPIQVHDNGPGRLIVMTDGGNTLLDSTTAHPLRFTHTPVISATATGLAGVTVNGQALRVSESGSLAASLTLRDRTLPGFAAMLDQTAGALVTAFQEADTTLSGTAAGLFTTGGSPPVALAGGDDVRGLARDIRLNTQADPEQGGALWRLRDGMQATSPGQATDNSFVLRALSGIEENRSYDSSGGLPGTMSLPTAAAQVAGLMQSARAVWTDRAESRASQALQARESLANKTAVNVDDETMRLLVVQQTYAATVQVIQAVSDMLKELSEIR
ncbi:MAG: flagellar hook-associated protein FlgK [Pseudoxanthomonas suwonensis]|nr:MAG: flagellar hook-associated protein FlgK [Pseudoxanthomonas suwonensis]